MINNCLNEKNTVYANEMQVRDWLHVYDQCSTIDTVLHKGGIGEAYNIGSNNEKVNIEIVRLIIETLGKSENLIQYVKDRPGHDEATEKVLSSKKGIFSHSLWELYLFCDIIIVSNSSRWIL